MQYILLFAIPLITLVAGVYFVVSLTVALSVGAHHSFLSTGEVKLMIAAFSIMAVAALIVLVILVRKFF